MTRFDFTTGDSIPVDHTLEEVLTMLNGGTNVLPVTASGTGRRMLVNWDHVLHAEEFDDSDDYSPERGAAIPSTRPERFDYDEE